MCLRIYVHNITLNGNYDNRYDHRAIVFCSMCGILKLVALLMIEADAMVECVSRDVDLCVGLRRNST